MDWLNYHHLHYFWVTARVGTLTGAAKELRLAPSTVSAQISQLEASLGHPLFHRMGRGLQLTAHGELVQAYADDIFALGREMMDAVHSQAGGTHAVRLRVGLSNNLPKLIAYRLLGPCLHLEDMPVHLVCHQDLPERLVADLAVHRLDVVISDSPVSLTSDIRVKSVPLGESGVSLFGVSSLVAEYGQDLPGSLTDAPVLLPESGSAMRGLLEGWFQTVGLRPRVVGEFGDSALLKAFGSEGAGLFPAPTLVRDEVVSHYGVEHLVELEGLVERFFAIVHPSRESSPVVAAILNSVAKG